MAELYAPNTNDDGTGGFVPVGYTEDDVQLLAQQFENEILGLGKGRKSHALRPFLHLLDGGDRAKA